MLKDFIKSLMATHSSDKLKNALNGKSGTNGGLNLNEFRAALITKFPHETVLINKYNRKELEEYYKKVLGGDKGENVENVENKSDNTKAPQTLKYLIGRDFTFKYSGKSYTRFVPTDPMCVKIDIKSFQPPLSEVSSDTDEKNSEVDEKNSEAWNSRHEMAGFQNGYPGSKEMREIELRLDAAKNTLDPIYEDQTYAHISDIVEYFKNLRKILKEKYHLAFASNAWLKMTEMLHYLPLIDDNNKELFVFHNCELPGAFIMATKYFMESWRPKREYDWRASSLVPGIDGNDNKINALGDLYKLWSNNKNKWIMSIKSGPGSELNGDTTKVPNIHYMSERLGKKANLYTSDAGIAVGFGSHETLAFNDQEQLNMLINLGQLLAMLETLAIDGNFVTKQYTFFKPFTYSLMIIVGSMFREFYLTKPLTSKITNSETYLVGIGFKGLSAEWKKYLEDKLSSFKGVVPMPGPLLPADVIEKNMDGLKTIISVADELYRIQSELIYSNFEIYNNFKKNPRELEYCIYDNRERCEQEWIEKFKINKSRVTQQNP